MKILLGISAIILVATSMLGISEFKTQKNYEINDNVSQEDFVHEENEELKFVVDEISDSNYGYDLTNKEIIKELSDLVIIGNLSEIKEVSNYIKKLDVYSATRTYTNVNNVQVLYQSKESKAKIDLLSTSKLEGKSIPVVFYGGTLPYSEYEKSLRESQKEKRASLLEIGKGVRTKENVYIRTKEKNQLDIEEDKKYLLYLVYDENFEAFMPISSVYGVMEYDSSLKNINNHITGKVETIEEII